MQTADMLRLKAVFVVSVSLGVHELLVTACPPLPNSNITSTYNTVSFYSKAREPSSVTIPVKNAPHLTLQLMSFYGYSVK